jgi:catechol 2,3-dioxygenase-like lactoylglutathione lyase family enzyme
MLGYVTLGANDLVASGRFYSALLEPLGYRKHVDGDGPRFSLPEGVGSPCALYLKLRFDGQPATVGDGLMNASRARSRDIVGQVHAAALVQGGTDEGAPGLRAEYSKDFYVAYVRDPGGNKMAVFCKDTRPE